jgi:hypothetical protein
MRFSGGFNTLSQELEQTPRKQKILARSLSVRSHAPPWNGDLNIRTGGTGGKGGYGGHTGGEGGLGEAAQLAIENVGLFRRIQGKLSFPSSPPKTTN